MLNGKLRWLPLALCLLCVTAHAQEAKLETGQPVEREIAGGESHAYQITMAGGQYVRFRLDQRAIDATLILNSPDGKPLVEMNLTRAGDEESLSFEAAIAGNYLLTVQAKGMGTLRGAYRLTTNWKDAATAQDKQRIAAESLMIEAQKLFPQAGKGAPQVIENLQKALPTWREQNEPSWEAWSLRRIGKAYSVLGRQDKAIEHLGQALSRYREAKIRSGEGETLLDLGIAYARLSQRRTVVAKAYRKRLQTSLPTAAPRTERLCLSHLDLMLARSCPEFRRGQGQPAIAACYDQLN